MGNDFGAPLGRALEISLELLAIAGDGDVLATARLDGERRRLLDSVTKRPTALDADERLLLQKIAQLNDQALGLLVHRRRRLERDIDMVGAGRRAVVAYSSTR